MQVFSTLYHHLKACVLGAASGCGKGKQNPHSKGRGRGSRRSLWVARASSQGGFLEEVGDKNSGHPRPTMLMGLSAFPTPPGWHPFLHLDALPFHSWPFSLAPPRFCSGAFVGGALSVRQFSPSASPTVLPWAVGEGGNPGEPVPLLLGPGGGGAVNESRLAFCFQLGSCPRGLPGHSEGPLHLRARGLSPAETNGVHVLFGSVGLWFSSSSENYLPLLLQIFFLLRPLFVLFPNTCMLGCLRLWCSSLASFLFLFSLFSRAFILHSFCCYVVKSDELFLCRV